MADKVSDFMLQRLVDWGIKRVYAFTGDGINGFLGAFDRIGAEKLEFVQTRHEDVAGEYVHMLSTPVQARHLIDRAVRIAKAERTVTCIIVPNDTQDLEAVPEPPRKHNTVHSSIGYTSPYVVPTDADLQRAATVL